MPLRPPGRYIRRRNGEASGYRSAGHNRELYIELDEDRDAWVTELQKPVITR